jgi:fructosamine-3-kinase
MPEADISWQVLRQIVQRWAGTAAELVEVKPLHGGCINTTLALATATGDKAVIKISPHRVNRRYQTEAHQLELLRSAGVPTPRVYALNLASLDNPDSYLLMEFIEGINLAEARKVCSAEEFDSLQQQLADIVLAMHERSAELYGRVADGEAVSYASWPQFYREVYEHIWQEAWKDPHLPVKMRKQIAKVHGKLDQLLAHDDRPRLVHWDLWANNMLCRRGEDGRWRIVSILDPECKWAHAEAEIAYLELFKTVTPAFMKRYQDAHKLPADYHRVRKPVYQMYELINHLRLFGPEYLPRLQQAVDQTALVA